MALWKRKTKETIKISVGAAGLGVGIGRYIGRAQRIFKAVKICYMIL